jgi:hypothetical protein
VYVVSNPADSNSAFTEEQYGNIVYADGSYAFQTSIQDAINACVDWRGDVILVGPRTYVVTTPMLFNKKGVTVISTFNISGEDNGERFTINADATPNIAAAIISEPCTIIGLGFDSANSANGTIVMGPGSGFDGGNFTRFVGCRFTNWGHAAWGIESNYNDYVKIEQCDFDGTINGDGGSANVFDAGVQITQGHYVTVSGCTFRGCTYAIVHGTPSPASASHSNKQFTYKDNYVIVAGGTEKFIDFNTLATYSQSYGLVANNWLPTATNTASYNDTVANAKTGGVAFSGNHYAE